MEPTVGRVVYYKSYGTPGGEYKSEDRAATITKVHNASCVDLCVFNPTGLFFNSSVVQGSDGGQWDWMPFQKGQAQKTEQLEQELLLNRRSSDTTGASSSGSARIARLCHEVNRAFCKSIGDDSQISWDEAPQWQKDSAIKGVEFCLAGDATPEQTHDNWSKDKLADGWSYGPVKDPDKKEHPCLVPYDKLPLNQRTKDYLFKAIVDASK